MMKRDDLTACSCRVAAPAKLNLRLKVEGRRADGYHLLSMLNVTISLQDEIEIEFSKDTGVRLEIGGEVDSGLRRELLDPNRNIAASAAELFFKEFSVEAGALLRITKRIPAGAGLGGGSSDAAAVLRALDRHFGKECPARLEKLALKLGADVPYLLRGGLAVVSGVGERISPLPGDLLNGQHCMLVLSKSVSPTKEIYELFRRQQPQINNSPDLKLADFARRVAAPNSLSPCVKNVLYGELLGLLENDLCEAACLHTESIRKTLQCLAAVPGLSASLTGSGSGIFVLPGSSGILPENTLAEVARALDGLDLEIIPVTLVAN